MSYTTVSTAQVAAWHHVTYRIISSDPYSLPHGCLAQEGITFLRIAFTVAWRNICISPQNVGPMSHSICRSDSPPVTPLHSPSPSLPPYIRSPLSLFPGKVDKKQTSEEGRPNAKSHFPLANNCDTMREVHSDVNSNPVRCLAAEGEFRLGYRKCSRAKRRRRTA